MGLLRRARLLFFVLVLALSCILAGLVVWSIVFATSDARPREEIDPMHFALRVANNDKNTGATHGQQRPQHQNQSPADAGNVTVVAPPLADAQNSESFFASVKRRLGDLFADPQEKDVFAVRQPHPDPAAEWASIDWTLEDSIPFKDAAQYAKLRAASQAGVRLNETEPMPSEISIFGHVWGPEYTGNTRENLNVWRYGTERVVIKSSSRNSDINSIDFVDAVNRIVSECGFHRIVPQQWTGKIWGSNTRAVFSHFKHGLTLDKMSTAKRPSMDVKQNNMRQALKRFSGWQIRLMALFDVFMGFKDRHAGNMIVDDAYNLISIDCVQNTLEQRIPFVDSILVPVSEKYAIHRLGWAFLFTDSNNPLENDDPVVLMDYRCHSRNYRIGFDYPAPFEQCLRRFASTSPQDIAKEYFSDVRSSVLRAKAADWLNEVSRLLLSVGYEETIRTVAVGQIAARGNNQHTPRRAFFYSFPPCCMLFKRKCVPIKNATMSITL